MVRPVDKNKETTRDPVEISETQAIKYAEEFSSLYWAEKKKRQELESAHAELKKLYAELDKLRQKLKAENEFFIEEYKNDQFSGNIIGQSPAFMNALEQIDSIAKRDVTVLIQGETGSGKELFAKEIHQRSLRSHRPIIKVNCGAIPNSLFESEFFGHKKGSFTGAVKDRIGRFQLADEGTLFLDEVGEIPLDLQVKLLRVLQEGQFEQVGDDVTKEINVRIVAATNRDLLEEVKKGNFREDLYYRLNVIPIQAPSLRERKEDIKLLAEYFLKQVCNQFKIQPLEITNQNIQQLENYDWPGNIRELQSIIQRAILIHTDGPLQFNFPQKKETDPPENKTKNNPQTKDNSAKKEDVKNLDKATILSTLEKTNWKVFGPRGAGEILGVPPANLAYRIKKLGLKKP